MKKHLILLATLGLALTSHAQSLLYPEHFDLSEVSITAGPMRQAMITNARTLLDYDADRLMAPFIREAGLDKQTGRYKDWLSAHPSFSNWGDYSWSLEGHVGGHYLTALALGFGAMRNDPALAPLARQLDDRLAYCLAILKDCQDAFDGDTEGMCGYLGGQPYMEMWRGMLKGDINAFRKHGGKVPFYCEHKVLAGLRDAYVYAGRQEAKEMFRKLSDWSISIVSKFDDKQMQDILNTEHGGMNEVLADAYYLFKEQKYLDAANRYSHLRMVKGLLSGEDGTYNTRFLDRNHANTQVPKYIGFERIAQLSENAEFSEATLNFFDDVARHRTVCIGGNSVGEHFLPADNCAAYMTNLEGPESCNSNNMLKLSESLFDVTHDARYADFYESTMWNHVLSTQDPQTGGYVYFTTLRPGGYRIYSQVNEGMWCCVGTGMENHSKYAHFAYTHSGKDMLFVNLFMPTELNSSDFGLRQTTDFPYEQATRLTITKGGQFTLAIRRPSWVAEGYSIKVNGTAVALTGAGYEKITRKWKAGDCIEVALPMTLRVEECPNYTDYVAFKTGPLLLAARTSTENESEAHLTGLPYERLQNEYADDSRMGHSPGTRGKKLSLNVAPMLIGPRADLLSRIQPKLPALHLYTIQPDTLGRSQWPRLTLEPFYAIHHARYSCYWYAQTPEEYANSPMVKADSIAAALDARTIDFVATGEQQSEAGHLMEASPGCTKGFFNSEACREVPTSNQVSYTFTNTRSARSSGNAEPIPATGLAVMLRFVQNDGGRRCSIYIDDQPLVEDFVCPRNHPSKDENNFINIEFPIPDKLLVDGKGKPKQSLRFTMKATDKGLAPSIFYLRLVEAALPLSYDQENTGAGFPAPAMPAPEALPVVKELPDPLAWSDGSGQVAKFSDWERRRNEIAAQIQHYGIGEKPSVKAGQVKARMDADTLIVDVTVGGQTLTLRSTIHYPASGQPPYALMIGTSMLSLPKQLFENRPIATLNFHEAQVNDYSQWRPHKERGEHAFDRLYPALKDNGAYSEWAWGVSRLIDGLQQLGASQTKIDTRRIGVSGCSYAGKMALYAGAFDERIALTIAQEPGGGGAAAWRVSHPQDSVENLDRTDYHWFLESQKENFGGEKVYRLPYDQHELCAMVCPRALLLIGNPDYRWLADDAMRVSAEAAHKVWERFGIGDRMQWSIVGGHMHCQLPESQWPVVGSFLDCFLTQY